MELGPKLSLTTKDGYGHLHPVFKFSLNIPGPIGDYIEASNSGYPWNKSHVQIGTDWSKGSVSWSIGPLHGQIFKKYYDWRHSL
jgi:hypothetical protein